MYKIKAKKKKKKTEFRGRLCRDCKKLFFRGLLYLPILLFDFSTCTSKSANYIGIAETRSL